MVLCCSRPESLCAHELETGSGLSRPGRRTAPMRPDSSNRVLSEWHLSRSGRRRGEEMTDAPATSGSNFLRTTVVRLAVIVGVVLLLSRCFGVNGQSNDSPTARLDVPVSTGVTYQLVSDGGATTADITLQHPGRHQPAARRRRPITEQGRRGWADLRVQVRRLRVLLCSDQRPGFLGHDHLRDPQQ